LNKKALIFFIILSWILFFPLAETVSFEDNVDNITLKPDAIGVSFSWSFDAGASIISSPAFIDINNDRNLEIVFGSQDEYVYCVNNLGTEQWKFRTDDEVIASPAIADINGDSRPDIIITSTDGQVYCLNDDGTVIWNYTTGGAISLSPMVVDINEDGNLDILVSSQDSYLYCLDTLGQQQWNYTHGGYLDSQIVVGDVDNDNDLEIILLWALGILQVDKNGHQEIENSNFDSNININIEPLLVDLDNDSQEELLFMEGGDGLFCLDSNTFSYHWYVFDLSYSSSSLSSIVAADINYDGLAEILCSAQKPGSTTEGLIYCYDSGGTQLWNFTTKGPCKAPPAIADFDGDQQW